MIGVVLLSIAASAASMSLVQEPKCYSNFDFQERLLEKMVTLDQNMKSLNDQFNQKIELIAELSAKLKTDTSNMESDLGKFKDHLQQEQEKKITELEAMSESKMKLDVVKKLAELDDVLTLKLDKIDTAENAMKQEQEKKLAELDDYMQVTEAKLERMSLDLHTMTNVSLEKIKGEASKPNVAFLARTVSDTSPGTNTVLVFTTPLTNTDNVYSTSTGYFTAPVDGTYWFSAQICGIYNKYVNIRIYVNDTMMTDATTYDADYNYSCTFPDIVAVLQTGDRVYVKTGPNTNSGTAIAQGTYRWAMFMGALVN